MSSVLVVFCIGFFLLVESSAAAGPQDPDFWQPDKQKHFALSAAVAGFTYASLRTMDYARWECLVTGVATGLLVGTAKEIYDKRVDPDDIKADAAGAMIGGGVFFVIDWAVF